MLDYRLISKIKEKLASEVELSPRYETLFYGLKRGHPRNVAAIHPFAFLTRRIIFVASLLAFIEQPVFSVLTFLCINLAMLAYGIHER